MKKVLFIDHEAGQGGSTVSLGYLIRGFIDAGYSVSVSTPKHEQQAVYFKSMGAEVIPCNPAGVKTLALDMHFSNTTPVFSWFGLITTCKNILKIFIGIWTYFRIINKIMPDLVYANEYVVIQALIAAKIRGKNTALHIRSRFLKGKCGIRSSLLKFAVNKFSDNIFPITGTEAAQLGDYSRSKVTVIGEFLDKGNFREMPEACYIKAKYSLPQGKKMVLFLGGILDIKGTYDFIKAAQIVLSSRTDVCFVIAGKEYSRENPEYHRKCSEEILHGELKGSMFYLGTLSEPNEIISACDVLVSLIVESHFSRPVIEAWARKKAVIITDTEHGRELVADKVNGLIVPVKGIKETAASIVRLIEDNEYAAGLGRQGFGKAAKEFDAEVNCSKIIELCGMKTGA